METLAFIKAAALAPTSKPMLAVFYFVWMAAYLFLHVMWDVLTPRTPKFDFGRLKHKHRHVYAAETFASSVILFLAAMNPAVASLVGETVVPIVLAGFSGILYALGELCPYASTEDFEETESRVPGAAPAAAK